MAILKHEDLFQKAKAIIGERDDDEALEFLEDLNDTISSDKDDDDWKSKYDDLLKEKEQLDKDWRKRYRDTFFSADSHTDKDKDTNPSNHANDTTDEIDKEEEAKKVRFDDLFTAKD